MSARVTRGELQQCNAELTSQKNKKDEEARLAKHATIDAVLPALYTAIDLMLRRCVAENFTECTLRINNDLEIDSYELQAISIQYDGDKTVLHAALRDEITYVNEVIKKEYDFWSMAELHECAYNMINIEFDWSNESKDDDVESSHKRARTDNE